MISLASRPRERAAAALLRAQRERVLIGARHLELLRDVLGGLGHQIDAVLRLDQRIDEAPADRRVVDLGTAREAVSALGMTNGARDAFLDAARDHQLRLAGPDRPRRVSSASMPEPHRRFTVLPGTSCGSPASSAMRATLRLSSPA